MCMTPANVERAIRVWVEEVCLLDLLWEMGVLGLWLWAMQKSSSVGRNEWVSGYLVFRIVAVFSLELVEVVSCSRL